MILIDNILVDEAIVSTPFLCNTNQCKGACCTVKGGSGAPLLDDEVERVEASVQAASAYLSERSQAEIRQRGATEGTAGEYATRCIDDRDCVFVYYESGSDVAKCAIERAYFDGKTPFRKPISCHLFPIRVADFNGPYLYYEHFPECAPALAHGSVHQATIADCVKDAIVRAYGEEWYEKLMAHARTKIIQQAQMTNSEG
jgi:hypothetical protein